MKKIICCLMAVIVIIGTSGCGNFQENVSNEAQETVTEAKKVYKEGDVLEPGEYVVGEDLEEGWYLFSRYTSDSFSHKLDSSGIMYSRRGEKIDFLLLDIEKEVYLYLEKNSIIDVYINSIKINQHGQKRYTLLDIKTSDGSFVLPMGLYKVGLDIDPGMYEICSVDIESPVLVRQTFIKQDTYVIDIHENSGNLKRELKHMNLQNGEYLSFDNVCRGYKSKTNSKVDDEEYTNFVLFTPE